MTDKIRGSLLEERHLNGYWQGKRASQARQQRKVLRAETVMLQ